MTHFLPPKALQLQKSYLLRGLFKPRYSNICEFTCRLNNFFEFLKTFSPFRISEEEIIELVCFDLLR